MFAKKEQEKLLESPKNIKGDVGKIISMGTVSTLVAIHLIGNNIILASSGNEADKAAVSLITSIQNVSSGIIFGILLDAGIQLGPAMAKKDNTEIGAIIKTSWVIGATSGLVLTGGLLSLPVFLSSIVDLDTARVTTDFFNMFAIGGAIAEPLIASNGIIISLLERNLDRDNWKVWGIQLLSMITYRAPALALGYLLSRHAGMGPAGVGLGTSISAILALAGTHIWFARNAYKDYGLYVFQLPNLKERIKLFLKNGSKLSLRRLSEWGNLAAISLVIGSMGNRILLSFSPFSQANSLIGFFLQGMSQGAMVFIGRDAASQRELYKEFKNDFSRDKLEEVKRLQNANRIAFHKNNLTGLILTGGLSGAIYLARRPLIELFTGLDSESDGYNLAELILLYGLLGLLPDALRIISSGILGAWDDVLYPTLANIFTMTILGVTMGAVISYEVDDKNPLPILWFRIAGMIVSAIINYYRFFEIHMKKDTQDYQRGEKAIAFLHHINNRNQNKLINLVDPSLDQSIFSHYSTLGFEIDQKESYINRNNILEILVKHSNKQYTIIQLKQFVAEELVNNKKYQPYLYLFTENEESHSNFEETNIIDKIFIEILASIIKLKIVVIYDSGLNKDFDIFVPNNYEKTIYLAYFLDYGYYYLEGSPNEKFKTLLETYQNFDNSLENSSLIHSNKKLSFHFFKRTQYNPLSEETSEIKQFHRSSYS